MRKEERQHICQSLSIATNWEGYAARLPRILLASNDKCTGINQPSQRCWRVQIQCSNPRLFVTRKMKNNEIRLHRFFELIIEEKGRTTARSERITLGKPGDRKMATKTDNSPVARINVNDNKRGRTTTRNPELCSEEDQAPISSLFRHRLTEFHPDI